jgi:hypothetical protein
MDRFTLFNYYIGYGVKLHYNEQNQYHKYIFSKLGVLVFPPSQY